MIRRNNDDFFYDSQGKLYLIRTASGQELRYMYDYTGNRIKKSNSANNAVTVSIDGLYEVSQSDNTLTQHTMYILGLKGDRVAMMTGTGWNFVPPISASGNLHEIPVRRASYLEVIAEKRNKAIYTFIVNYREYMFRYHLGLFVLAVITTLLLGIYFAVQLNHALVPLTTPMLILSIFITFTFSGCLGVANTGQKDGDPPWYLLPDSPEGDSPQIGTPTTSSGTPTRGMYYFHPAPFARVPLRLMSRCWTGPDHLGSTTLITDAKGNRLSGNSQVAYLPYGEIDRANSAGPDIFRHKYTGQEEDTESGLLYYKARYYDPKLGRFLQPDALIQPGSPFGMNRYMYVDGNFIPSEAWGP